MNYDDLQGVPNLIAIIIVVIIGIISAVVSLLLDKTLTIKNKEKTSGVIVDIVNIRYYWIRTMSYYEGTIVVEYEVDGNKYYTTKDVRAIGKFNVPNTDNTYNIGDKKTVAYNKELPVESAVDEIELYEIVIYIIFIIEISILIVLIYKRVTRKKKYV